MAWDLARSRQTEATGVANLAYVSLGKRISIFGQVPAFAKVAVIPCHACFYRCMHSDHLVRVSDLALTRSELALGATLCVMSWIAHQIVASSSSQS